MPKQKPSNENEKEKTGDGILLTACAATNMDKKTMGILFIAQKHSNKITPRRGFKQDFRMLPIAVIGSPPEKYLPG